LVKLVEEMYTKLGQLDYAAELSQIRARSPTRYMCSCRSMGINFIKAVRRLGDVARHPAGGPLWGSDQDIIRRSAIRCSACSASATGRSTRQPANKRFVAEFEKEYKRLHRLRGIGLRHGDALDSAIRKIKGKIEDRMRYGRNPRRRLQELRGDFKFGKNQFPVQNYYLQSSARGPDGRIVHKTMGTVLTARGDAYVQDCKMP